MPAYGTDGVRGLLNTGLIAALLLTLPAGAQEAPQRFLYLGRADQFAVMASEATGPQSARMLSLVVASSILAGPGGSDTFLLSVRSDCAGNLVQLMSAQAWSGADKLEIATGAAGPHAPDAGTPYELAFNYACKGQVPNRPEIWIESADAARAYAHTRANDSN